MSDVKKNGHGGFRAGAGNKSIYEKTIVMRIPEKYKESIKALIKHLDDSRMIDKNYPDSESAPVFIRSLDDKPQQITFKVSSIKKQKKGTLE